MASTPVLLLQLLLVSLASASHHFGGKMTFTYKGRNADGTFSLEMRNKAIFDGCALYYYSYYNYGWSCYTGNCGTETTNHRQTGIIDRSTNAPRYNSQWCETETVSRRKISSDKPFQMRASGCCWIPTRNSVWNWRLMTYVDLGTRSDTGKPNRSPDVAVLPFLRVPQNCPRTYRLMAFDPDDDKVRCRYGNIRHVECSTCNLPSGFHLDQDSCTLYYRFSYAHTSVYAFEMAVEDFPRGSVTLAYSDGSRSSRAPLRRKRQAPFQYQTTITPPHWTPPATTTTNSWWWWWQQSPTTASLTTTAAAPTTTTPITTTPWWWWWHGPTTASPTTTAAAPTTTTPITTNPWWRWWHGPTTASPTTTAAAPTTTTPITTTPWWRWWHGPTTASPTTTAAAPTTTTPITTTPWRWWWHGPTTASPTTTAAAPTTTTPITTTTTGAPTTTTPITTTPWWRWWHGPTTASPTTTAAAPTTTTPITTTPWWWWHDPITTTTTTGAPTTTTPITTTTTGAPTTTTPITTTPWWWWHSPITTAPTTTTTTGAPTTTTPITPTPWWWWHRPTTTVPTTTEAPTTTTSYTTSNLHATTPPLSKLPLQFSFLVDPPVPSCQEGLYLPKLVSPTPANGARIHAEVNKEVEIRVKAQASHTTVHDIIMTGPLNISKHRTTHGEFVIRWTPTPDDLGEHYPVCFAVESVTLSAGTTAPTTQYHYHRHNPRSSPSAVYQSEMRCVLVDVGKQQIKSNVICNESTMTVEVEKSSFSGLHEDHLRLNDPTNTACSLTRHSNSTHIIAVIPLNACGTQIEEDDDNLNFKNEITTVDNSQDLITRKHLFEVQFCCQYPKRGNVSLGFTAHRKNVTVWEKGFGTFTYDFEFYQNSRFQTMIDPNSYPVEYELGSRIYMQIEATSSVNNTELFVESCRAAPYDNPNYRPIYSIIDNGCKVDSTVEMHSPAHKRQFRFSMEAFKFIGLHNQVYISCSVMMCEAGDPNTRCSRGCINSTLSGSRQNYRGKREVVTQSSRHQVSQGPLRLRRSAERTGSPVMNLNLNLVFIAGCLLAAVGMICAAVMYKVRVSSVRYQPLPTFES